MKLPPIALLLLAASACHAQTPLPVPTPAAADLARRIAGCYRLDDGPWRADSVVAGDVSTAGTPLFFELTDRLLSEWAPIQTSESPMFAVRSTDEVWGYWQGATNPDRIRVASSPLAFAGVDLFLTPAGRDLEGTVTASTDAVEAGKPSAVSRAVYARRVACPPAPKVSR
jgi:hypothetical protein